MTPRQLERVFRLNMVFARRQYKKVRGRRLPSGQIMMRLFLRALVGAVGFHCVRLAREYNAHVTFRFEVKEGYQDD